MLQGQPPIMRQLTWRCRSWTPFQNWKLTQVQLSAWRKADRQYLNEERVKCQDGRRDCLSKAGGKCHYASCFWIFCLYSEKSRCEIDEPRKCHDYFLGGCLTEWQRYLQGYAKENVSQICEVIIHLCSLFYGISMFIGDWRVLSQRRHPKACQNLSHKEEQWAIVSHLITSLFMLSVIIAMHTLFENDPRKQCSLSVFLLAVYLALSKAFA